MNHPYSAAALAARHPSTSNPRAMMKRLLSKPAPPSSSTTHRKHQETVQEIIISPPPRTDSLPPQSPNEFDKSIRALDLVGQIDISMPAYIESTRAFDPESVADTVKKQQNVPSDPGTSLLSFHSLTVLIPSRIIILWVYIYRSAYLYLNTPLFSAHPISSLYYKNFV